MTGERPDIEGGEASSQAEGLPGAGHRILRNAGVVLGVLLLVAGTAIGGLWFLDRPYTPRIETASGESVPGSVATLERVELGGVEQWILVRGRDRNDPVLLFLHGGPGMPAMFLHHVFGPPLEAEFVVVHWDQRGAGKSYSEELSPEALSVERILADAVELIGLLRKRFGPEPIYLVGHSWGSYLGMQLVHRRPELFRAYVGVGQVTDPEEENRVADEFIRATARRTGRTEAIGELEERGAAAREEWLFEFGGELHGETSFLPLVLAGLRSPEYGFADVFKVAPGSSFSSRHMTWDGLDGPLVEEVTAVDVPLWFFAGRYDYVTPSELAVDYLERLDAPRKGLVWFEESAHFPFFEEPGKFARELVEVKRRVEGS